MKKYFCLDGDLNPGPLNFVSITLPLSYGSTDGNHAAKPSIYVWYQAKIGYELAFLLFLNFDLVVLDTKKKLMLNGIRENAIF